MFETAMLDSTARSRAQRRWTTLLSIAVQVVLVGGLLLLPVISPDSIQRLRFAERIIVPAVKASGPELAAAPDRGTPTTTSNSERPVLLQPPNVPEDIITGETDVPVPSSSDIPARPCLGICGTGGGSEYAVPGGLGPNFVPTVRETASPPKRVIVSVLDPGFLLRRVQPVYPPIAKQAGIQGAVVLRAVIGRDGEIQELRVVSGHPLLSSAAKDAVAQWRYRPYMLNGAPVEVETQVTVNFYLSGRW
ncbi:MAG: energy transducer TonB [Terriglobales bacterium]